MGICGYIGHILYVLITVKKKHETKSLPKLYLKPYLDLGQMKKKTYACVEQP